MTIKASPRQPVVLDDDWEPPPRPRRIPLHLIGAVLAVGCVAFVVIRAVGSKADRPSEAPWSPLTSRSTPFADSGPPPLDPAPHPAPPPRPPLAPPPAPRRALIARRPVPSRPGYLSINSTPWAELSVDGTVVGNTPQLRIRVSAGRHQLVFSRDGFETQRTWVTVEPGATVRITDIALKRTVAAR